MPDQAFEGLRWLDPTSNPFGVRCLDCRLFSRSMLSTTADPNLAERFSARRASTGVEYVGQYPESLMIVPCRLLYARDSAPEDGPLFVAEAMEDKWDICLHDGSLYFARSWTGALIFRAQAQATSSKLVIGSARSTPMPNMLRQMRNGP